MDKEVPLLPGTAFTIGDHAQVFAEPAAGTRPLGETRAEGLLSWTRWDLFFITFLPSILDLTHKSILLLLVGSDT